MFASQTVRAELAVETDFPGGSGEVVSIDQGSSTIVLNPSDHPDRGWRCWWYFRLNGITPGKAIILDVGEAPWATPKQATFSIDDGKTWQHSNAGTRDGKRIRYSLTFGTDIETALVAWGPPFVPDDAKALVEKLADASDEATVFSLCRTREDRDTPALRIGTAGKPLIWVQARQHAWESGASWVGKGFAEWIVSDAPQAAKLRTNHEIVFVPIMDIDNVHRGAGGKSQKPQDHNRDWSDNPHWNAVAAAQKELRSAAEADRLLMFIDLHNPGATNLFPYFYVPPADILSAVAKANLTTFLDAAKTEITGPLRFTGKVIESGAKYDPKAWTTISKNWVARLGTPAISVTLETAWNTPASTTAGYQTVGRQLGMAMARFSESSAQHRH
jgi:hypothetical protein